jgi:hypothetical protein
LSIFIAPHKPHVAAFIEKPALSRAQKKLQVEKKKVM